jgi:endonuclease-3
MVRARAQSATPASSGELASQARVLLRLLRKAYPDAGCTLDFGTPVQLLVATILSAQCTDERVNALAPGLFRRYPDARAFAAADRAELEEAVRPTGFFRNKARSIQNACRTLEEKHGGQVPRAMDELTSLAGVGRKTANVLRSACFDEQAVVVDTHVKRVSARLGLTAETDPERVERDLMACLPGDSWSFGSQSLILHGRQVCKARKPLCGSCTLARACPSVDVLSL